MAEGMDFNQDNIKCAYPPCPAARARPDDPTINPFCQMHIAWWELVVFQIWATQQVQRQMEAAVRGGKAIAVASTVPTIDIARR